MKTGNSIGIDHQATATVVAVRETHASVATTRSVGDGFYAVIPNAVVVDTDRGAAPGPAKFGTTALADEAAAPVDYSRAETVRAFWDALVGRLYGYLGRVMPVEAKGYSVVLCPGAGVDRAAAAAAARSAGLRDIACVAPAEAVLARWAFSEAFADGEFSVVAVAVGDRAAQVEAFSIDRRARSGVRVLQRSGAEDLAGYGDQIWRSAVIDLLSSRLIEPPPRPLDRDPAVLAAIRRFAAQLRTDGGVSSWTGNVKRLFASIDVSFEDAMSWPSARSFLLEVTAAVAHATERLEGPRPGIVVAGGVGAHWPFLDRAASIAGRFLVSERPAEDVAIGCCWWPGVQWEDAPEYDAPKPLGAAAEAPLAKLVYPDLGSAALPPWRRRELGLDASDDEE
jgi:hypothetical protein